MSVPLLAELKRRRVFRALVGYGIVAFAVLQIIEPVMHGLHWPDGVLSYVVVALAVGFPIVVALAWIFDVRGGHIERTSGGRLGARRGLLLACISAVAAAPGLIWYFGFRGTARTPAAPPSIVVLPFVNMSGDKENEYFSDGMTEEIINALANVEGLRVVARTSAFSFKGKNVDVRRIGEDLNVATVLEGSVRRQGNQLRVAAQLISLPDGYHLWSKTYERELNNVFAVEDEVARAIVQALAPKLLPGLALAQATTVNTEAHDLYLRGRYFWNQRTREALTKAQSLFEQAIALDAGYALAYSGLSDCYNLLVDYGGGRAADLLPKAKKAALKALELDGASAEAHASLGAILQHEYDWAGSNREFRRAIELRPGYVSAHHWYALNCLAQGRFAEARSEIERARQLDPTSVFINGAVAVMLNTSREYDLAIVQAFRTLDLDPNYTWARVSLVSAYLRTGRAADALAVLDKGSPSSRQLQAVRAWVLAEMGSRAAAQALLSNLESSFDADPVSPLMLARAHVKLGDVNGAFHWLDEAVESRDSYARLLTVDPLWDPIRSDSRYDALVRRLNLE